MENELSPEEKKAADEINASAAEEKTQLEKIGEDVTGVSALLKSHVEEQEKANAEPAEPEAAFDIHSVSPEDFAKSMTGTKEEKIDYINRLTDSCGLMPQDMIDEDGGRYFSDEMMKSLENATTEVQGFMSATMYAMQEANERTAKKDSLMFQTQIDMAKSIESLAKVVGELSEKIEKSIPTTEITPTTEKSPLPDLDGTATKPVSEQVDLGGKQSKISSEVLSKAVNSAFPGLYGDVEDLKLQAKYADWAARMTPEEAMAAMPEEHRNMVICQIPN